MFNHLMTSLRLLLLTSIGILDSTENVLRFRPHFVAWKAADFHPWSKRLYVPSVQNLLNFAGVVISYFAGV